MPVNRIRAWIVRTIFGYAPTTPPDVDQQNREGHPGWTMPTDLLPSVNITCHIDTLGNLALKSAKDTTMKTTAGELNTTHINKTITVTRDGTTITGPLVNVKHDADLINDSRMWDAMPSYVLGKTTTTVNIMHAGRIELASGTEVEVSE